MALGYLLSGRIHAFKALISTLIGAVDIPLQIDKILAYGRLTQR